MTTTTKETTQAPDVAPKTPKAVSFPASGEVRQVKAGTKLALLIDLLARPEGATLEELATELSRTGSAVNVSGVRSWLSYDLRRVGLGVVQPDDHLHLVGTPLSHREGTPAKVAESKPQLVAEPKVKRAAMTAARSKKAARA